MLDVLKKLAFGLSVTVAVFALIELTLSFAGVVPLYERADPYVGFSGYAPLFVRHAPPGVEPYYETAHNKVRWFNSQRFPAGKADGTFRIFCIGGSTTYGRPYDDRTSFCGWLREFLPAVDPSRNWQVVNAGGISYASYRAARLMEELAGYEPDLFIIYTGHNEFLERRTYDQVLDTPEFVRNLGTLASHLRMYSALHDVTYDRGAILPAEVKATLDRSVGPDDYRRDDEMRGAVLEHFESSLERMVAIAQRAGAETVLVTPASNIGDFSPFKADPGPHADALRIRRVDSLRVAAERALEEERPARAVGLMQRALDLDDRHAELHYLHGQALVAQGKAEEAREAFIAARDEDICPLRAPTRVLDIVAEVARDKDTGFVDFARIARTESPEGIPGSDLFLDHVHPTIEGNRILALALVREMVDEGLVSPAGTWNEAAITQITERVEGSLDEQAHAAALKNLSRVLMWAGKDREAARLIDEAVEETAEDGETHLHKATMHRRAGDNEEALHHYREAVRLSPWDATAHQGYGSLLSEFGRKREALTELQTAIQLDRTQVEAHYDLGIVLKTLGRSREAEAAYRAALALDPNHADAHNNLGVILAQRGDLKGAAEEFAEAVRVDPGHRGAAANLARARGVSR